LISDHGVLFVLVLLALAGATASDEDVEVRCESWRLAGEARSVEIMGWPEIDQELEEGGLAGTQGWCRGASKHELMQGRCWRGGSRAGSLALIAGR
jgi:hypothetical protein